MSFDDRTAPVRKGEELDLDALRPWIAAQLDLDAADLQVQQYPGGHSNLTYRVQLAGRDLVLRRPPFGSRVKRAHDMGREYRVLSRLSQHRPWAPRPVAFCDDPAVLGADFYLMERIGGVILRRQAPTGMTIDEATARRICETLLDTLVELHSLDYQAIGLGDLGKPEGFVERQVSGWTKRYQDAQTDEIAEMPEVASWLAAHMPRSPAPTVIHNDFKLDNVIFDSEHFERVVGVLDWEMATVGDPLIDLGTTLCYWVEAGDSDAFKNLSFGPTHLPGMYTRAQLAERYAEKTGRDVGPIVFYYAFGLFKTAVVLQQIYYRYQKGLTSDPRFAGLIFGVRLLAEAAEAAIAGQSL